MTTEYQPYIWNAIPYLIRISVAKKAPRHKCRFDPRYDGWSEVWAKCGIEQFDRELDKKFRNAYLKQTLDMVDALPSVNLYTKTLTVSTADSAHTSSMCRYYGKNGNVSIRVGVEMILNPSIFW